ncbi:MAG: hypothetical protein ACRC30_10210 [Clostridium sp.]
MIIKAFVVPTPRRIKKKIRALEKEDIFLYFCILTGMGIINVLDLEHKEIPLLGLTYCGISYEILRNMDDETLRVILQNHDLNKIYFNF